jgi:uncharacterized protein YbbC (DUF1343 family)
MEACAENNIELIILDRPNERKHWRTNPRKVHQFCWNASIPVLHGMTIGEYSQMINRALVEKMESVAS